MVEKSELKRIGGLSEIICEACLELNKKGFLTNKEGAKIADIFISAWIRESS